MTDQPQPPLNIREVCIEESTFLSVNLNRAYFEDVSLIGATLRNANLSDLEIEGAQLGGAYFHQIGMPPKDHPHYDPLAKQQPLRFDDCELSGSTFVNCNLEGVELTNCLLKGMRINGILVEELLALYGQQ
ncbi:pentapeptide repeat-containing protein [Fibrisoma montanum]|nr:pentapeptide repeat-containing protein [Fibrisoma montanum]